MKPSSASTGSDTPSRVVLVLLLALAAIPILVTPIPAMVDYPNHLARMFLLARDSANASPFYEVRWALYPNLAMDLLVPPLGRIIGVELATRFFLLLSAVLVVGGAMTLERVVKGRVEISGFIAVLFIYSLPFTWGFLNFEFGVGIALFGIAAALALQNFSWRMRLASYAVFSVLLFTAHFFALGFFGFAIGLHELARARALRTPFRVLAGRLIVLALPAAVLLALMVATGGGVGGEGTSWFFFMKPTWVFAILNGYNLFISGIGVAILAALIVLLARRGALRFRQSGAWLAIGFTALYLVMPSRLLDTSFVDVRVLAAAALILPAFVTVAFPNSSWRWAALVLVSVIALAQIATVMTVWTGYRPEYAAMRSSFALLDPGARVLVAHSGDADDPPMANLAEYPIYNAPTLAVNDADAFVPNFYAAAGKQPVTVRPEWEHLAVLHAGPAPIRLLAAIAEQGAPAGTPPFIAEWPEDYDYLYLLGSPIPNPMPGLLEELDSGARFVLYRILEN
jgi:hypothetical protein